MPVKQETIHNTTPKINVSQEVSLSTEEVKKQIDIFAQAIKQHEVKEILNAMPLEVKKEAITLFTNIPEHENWVNQIKSELLAHLRQYFQQDSLQILIRRPYTDSEKLYFFKQKYPKVNELVNKLGLDLR